MKWRGGMGGSATYEVVYRQGDIGSGEELFTPAARAEIERLGELGPGRLRRALVTQTSEGGG